MAVGSTLATRLFDHRRHYLELETEQISDRVGIVKPVISEHIVDVDDINNPTCMVTVVKWTTVQTGLSGPRTFLRAFGPADQTSEAR